MRSNKPGFSLIEIMIVIVIIGLMAGLVTVATTGYIERAKRQRARSDVATYSGAVDAFYLA
ncbi:MAG TPA: prepilin-type N-terminal cleavage/methylation domain-containing protein, partial [Tepidisphaeraceae bacterium]|nr:prepilin-type N-terminal cleavage/methylation domain-containing protein [Tepidisphaeraceae bacterium]